MKQIELFKGEVLTRQRLATSRVVNSAYREVTTYMKPEGGRYRAVTQGKRLSSEIIIVPEAESAQLAEGSSLISVEPCAGNLHVRFCEEH